jgi:hypothetical protein
MDMVLSTLTAYELADEFDLDEASHSRAAGPRSGRSRPSYNAERRYAKRRRNSIAGGMHRRGSKHAYR